MATFNILSSCICRDAFGFREDCKHDIITFLQSTSPFTWFELSTPPKRLLVPEDFDGITQLSNFQKKCIITDYNNAAQGWCRKIMMGKAGQLDLLMQTIIIQDIFW